MDVSKMSDQVELLHERVDELLAKLGQASALLDQVAAKFDRLPSEDELNDYSRALPAPESLQQFADLWNSDTLPTIDELQDYANAASAGLQAAG